MPYVTSEDRFSHHLTMRPAENAGQLNYQFTQIVQAYLKEHGLRYSKINDIIGALEGCKREFQRRVVDPYEVLKVLENGDFTVYKELENQINCDINKARGGGNYA